MIECKNCNGKGHILNGIVLFPLMFFLWPVALGERNTKDGLTREICEHCDGTGLVKQPK